MKKKISYLLFLLAFLGLPKFCLAALDLGDIDTPSGFKPDFASPGGPLEDIFSTLLAVFTIIGGLMFIIYFALATFRWITSGDKTEQAEKARQQMTNGLLGLIVLVASFAFFYIISLILGLKILEPAGEILKLKP